MKFTIAPETQQVARRLGPVCIACGNTKQFLVHARNGERVVELVDLPDGEYRVLACGRCSSRNSIVIGHIY